MGAGHSGTTQSTLSTCMSTLVALGEDGKALGTSQVLGGPQGSTILSVIHHLPKYHVTHSSRCLAEATKITTPRDKGRKKQKEETTEP